MNARLVLGKVFSAMLMALAPTAASADAFTQPGFGAEAIGLGGALTASRSGPASIAYNPAGLNTGEQRTTVSYLWAKPKLYIETDANQPLATYLADGPGRYPSAYYLAGFQTRINKTAEQNAERVPLLRGIHFGSVIPLAKDRSDAETSFGFGIFLPQGKLASINLVSESAPYFADFHDRNQAAVMSAGLGRDLPAGFSVGIGVVIDLIQAGVQADVYAPVNFNVTDIILTDAPLLPEANIQPAVKVHVAPRIRPTAGVQYEANDKLRFGLSFRDESNGTVEADGSVALGAGTPNTAVLPWRLELNTHFQPRRLNAGVKWEPLEKLSVGLDVGWEQWSRYSPPLAAYSVSNVKAFAANALAATSISSSGLLGSCIQVGGAEMCLPTQDALLARIPNAIDVRYEFAGAEDIVTPRVGFGWQWNERLRSSAGYYYRPSFESDNGFQLTKITTYADVGGVDIVERKQVDINLLDNARHGFSVGTTYEWGMVSFSVAALYVQLVEKTVEKSEGAITFNDATPAPGYQVTAFGYPGYSYGGHIAGGSGQFTLSY